MIERNDSEADLLKQDARRWVTRLVSGEATTADAESLKRWRQQSSAHEAAYAEAIRFWKDLGSGGQVFIARQGVPVWSAQRDRMTRRMLLGGAGALAATAATFAIMSPPLDLWPSLAELKSDYRTATGEQRRIRLGDVAVQMNTQTSIAIPSKADVVDHVRLIAGEALFTMPSQSDRQLVVAAGSGRTVASKARFDVRNVGSTVCITCFDGLVHVEQGIQKTTVGAGQQFNYNETGFGKMMVVDPHEAASWQEGFIVFRYTPLSAAVDEINRYRPGKVVLLTKALAQKTLSGRFRIDRIDDVLSWIERATGAKGRALPGGIVLLS